MTHHFPSEIEKLKRFVGKCLPPSMEEWDGVDGFQLEEICLECGILERVERTEFCGEECACASYYGSGEFPIKCNRLTPLGLACSRHSPLSKARRQEVRATRALAVMEQRCDRLAAENEQLKAALRESSDHLERHGMLSPGTIERYDRLTGRHPDA